MIIVSSSRLHICVSRAAVLSHLKTYNLYYEGQNLQLRHREVCISSFLHDCVCIFLLYCSSC